MNRKQRRQLAGKEPVQIPITKQILLTSVQVAVGSEPGGGKQLQITNPVEGAVYLVPLPAEIARKLGEQLITTLDVAGADELPQNGQGA